MNVDQAVDWATEPRLPHHLPTWMARGLRYRALNALSGPTGEIKLALTFDVEQDFGSNGNPDSWASCEPFLHWLGETAGREEWRTTLFVQGSIVEPLGGVLRQLAPNHELGLHGYYHELWGRQLWFTPQPGTPVYLRRELLKAGLLAFARAGLPRPRSFRAPNLVADAATLNLLDEAGFELDSSDAAFRGCPPIVTRRGHLVRIPVSASPIPRVHRRFGLPTWAPYRLLNWRTFLFLPPADLLDLVREIVAVQDAAGSTRHLVVLAHPWEFEAAGDSSGATANYQQLVDRVRFLNLHLPLATATLSELAGLHAAEHSISKGAAAQS